MTLRDPGNRESAFGQTACCVRELVLFRDKTDQRNTHFREFQASEYDTSRKTGVLTCHARPRGLE